MASGADTWTAPAPVTPAEFLTATDGAIFPSALFFEPALPAR